MKIFLQIFATKIGWLGITLTLAVIFGYKASITFNNNYEIWYSLFKLAIIYPLYLIIAPFVIKIIKLIRK